MARDDQKGGPSCRTDEVLPAAKASLGSAANPLPVTVVVPVRNEAMNLPLCLARLGPFAEVVVVDSQSTDGTREIATSFGARLIDFDWNGRFPKKRSWVLLNHAFTTPWVLFLDADELVTEEFVTTLRQLLPAPNHDGFWLRYNNHFMGRQLRYGVPQRKLALFRVGVGTYEQIDEIRWSDLDMEVHEHPVLEGSIGVIRAPLEHKDDRGLEHFITRHNSYSSWEAKRFLRIEADGDEVTKLTVRQKVKYRALTRWWFAPAYFMLTYVLRLGFLDGEEGYVYAWMKAAYFSQVRAKIIERRNHKGAEARRR